MKKEEIDKWFDEVYDSIIASLFSKTDTLKVDNNYDNPLQDLLDRDLSSISDKGIIHFYQSLNWWKVHWITKENVGFIVEGVFEFLPFEQVLWDIWDKELGGNSWAPDMKGFRPMDMFYESAGSVGFFVGRPDKKGLYLDEGGIEAIPLHVDMEGYLKLLAMSKGYGWWQHALVEISTGIPQADVPGFKEEMPKLFPDFKWEEFVALYESVRIDK